VQLVRFAYLHPRAALRDRTRVQFGDVEIVAWDAVEDRPRLVSASVVLDQFPEATEGCVSIPEQARRSAERALERTGDLLSVSRGSVCALSSPNLPVAFRGGSASEQEWLTSHNEIAGFTRLVAQPDVSPGVDVQLVTKLGDRPDGVALLAETVASQRLLGQFKEAVRVFERAFARSSDRLVPVLADFLERRPVLGFTKTEVKNWISRIRGRVVHADRHKHEPALEADVRPYTARMILAAYEVVLQQGGMGHTII